GYGRRSASNIDEDTARKIGGAVVNAGKNAFIFSSYNGTTIERSVPSVVISKTSDSYKIARNQTHNSYEGRKSVIRELTFDEYKKDPTQILDERAEEMKPWGGI